MKRKIILFSLFAGLLLFAACNRQGGTSRRGAPIPSDPGPLGRYHETLNLSWGINSSSVQKFLDGDTYDNNVWTRRIKEDLNINVTVAFSANWETGAFSNQVNLALASGDLPDLLRFDNYRQFKQAVDAGYIADITDSFNQYAGEMFKRTAANYPDSLDYIIVNNRMYGIPPFNGNEQMAPLLWIRQDWLDAVGMQPPGTVQEMIELARMFTFNDPNRSGRNDTYGLGMQSMINVRDHGTIGGLLSAFGIPTHGFDVYYPGRDRKITSPYIQPEVKEALQVLQDMYREGLIDPEFITTDMTKIQQDISRGRFGMAYGPQWGTWSPWNYAYSADNNWAVTRCYPIPTQAGFTPKYGYNINKASGEIIVINSRVSNPEALIKLVNHFQTVLDDSSPDADANREKYSDQEQYRFNPAAIGEPTEVRYGPVLYHALTTGDTSQLAPTQIDWYNKILAFESNPRGHDPDTYGRWGQYAIGMSMDIILNQYRPSGNLVESYLAVEQPQSLIDLNAELTRITDVTFTEIITGQRPVSSFDQYVQDWLRAGGQRVLDDLDAIYGSGAR